MSELEKRWGIKRMGSMGIAGPTPSTEVGSKNGGMDKEKDEAMK